MRRTFLRIAVIFAIILFIISIGSVTVNYLKNHNLRTKSDSFVNAVLANDSKQSFDMLTAEAQQANPLSSSWIDFINKINISFYNRKPTYSGTYIANKYHVVEYSILTASGLPYKFTVTLSPSGIGWKVVSFWSMRS
jgi:hypothetical protein